MLKELLFDLLDEYLEKREQAKSWKKEQCPRCHFPVPLPDAFYCCFCASPLHDEVILPSIRKPVRPHHLMRSFREAENPVPDRETTEHRALLKQQDRQTTGNIPVQPSPYITKSLSPEMLKNTGKHLTKM